MKFKTYVTKDPVHKTAISCIDWSNNEEVYSAGDEHQIYKWTSTTRESVEVAKLPDDFTPTDFHWLLGKSGGQKGTDSLLVTSNDGRFIILNKSARVERNINAHSMSITSGRWSPDGAGLLTASEDGIIKIWSRSGMLRSTVVQSDEPVRCARWSPTSSAIAYCQGNSISIKPLAANSKIMKWRAHDGLVLCLDWCSQTQYLASGGEDFRYKIWDSQGANIYTSTADEYGITSIEFCPNSDILAVGSFNILKLCSNTGWSYNNARFNASPVGSIYSIAWSPDGTQVACGSSSGNIVFGHVIERQLISKNLKVTTTGRKSILYQDITGSTSDVLDFPDRIINWAIGYGHLIVATPNQIHIFNENYINTPIIVDGRTDTRIIEIGKKFFLVVDSSSIWVYTYTGRLHLNPRFPGSQAQIVGLNKSIISLGLDCLAVRDSADQSVIYAFDLLPGASRQTEPSAIHSKTGINEIAVSRSGTPEDQYIVFLDVNRELYISPTQNGDDNSIHKIGTQVISVMWSSEANILVGLHDAYYSIWYCPGEGSSDPSLIALTTVTMDSTEFGKNIALESFVGPFITIKSSGTLYTVNANIYCEIMHRMIIEGQWNKALKICRLAQNTILWAALAAIATKKRQLDISEEAYSAALQIDKVSYLQYIKGLPNSSPEQMAENSLMMGRLVEAETLLLHNKKYKEAMNLCIRMHNWDRALDIAKKNNVEMDLILGERKKYLMALGREENNEKFLELNK
ncbi:unnamed protein product [Hermetia illucens]|uniref:Intraflagellar transport protein 80 homolog n=1 Tax=Hermetia illucens TaxID=343691 RepID=A0A7R8UFW0_HERIL|nr:intraflagellar transport protein 80 homolog [Hermetia illucens]CAD7079958.1 unnamed protein product [Hermetia illucens]